MTLIHSQLPDGQFVILCGAGISSAPPSNAPLWRPMRDFIIESSIERITREGTGWDAPYPKRIRDFVEQPTLAKIAPEVLFQVIQSTLGGVPFESLLASVSLGTPNMNHRAIASLVARGAIAGIVTTNFDCHIEQCLNEENVKFVAISDENTAKEWLARQSDDEVPVLKIHGSIDRPGSIVATVKSAGRVLAPHKAAMLRNLVGGQQILLTGYSGNDYDVFPELLNAVASGLPTRVFVNAFRPIPWTIADIAAATNEVTLILDIPAEYILTSICDKWRTQIPEVSTNRTCEDWRTHIKHAVDEIHLIDLVILCGKLAVLVGDFKTAMNPFFIIARDLCEDALTEGRSVDYIRRSARVHAALMGCYVWLSVIGQMNGELAARLGASELEWARRRSVDLGDDYTDEDQKELWWCRLNGSAWLQLCAGELDAAESLFRNSVERCEIVRTGEFTSIGDETVVDAYIGLGNTLLAKGDRAQATSTYLRALELSREFGSLWLAARARLALAKVSHTEIAIREHIAGASRKLAFMGLGIDNVAQYTQLEFRSQATLHEK